ncbi:MAG: hypothetical protein AAGC57_15480 [Pseudomonadota bacterium]
MAALFWHRLDAGTRARLDQIIQEVTHEYNGLAFQTDEGNRARVVASGVPVIAADATAGQGWVDPLRPVRAQFADQIGPRLLGAAGS